MKKIILAVFVILIVAFAGIFFYVFSNLDAIVKAAIEKFGSEAVHTSVKVDNVNIKLTEGTGSIRGLTVANPKGFSQPYAFSLGEITTKLNIDKTSQDLIAIDLIRIGAPKVFYEINAERKGSLNILKDNLSGGKKSASTAAPPQGQSKQEIQLAIARFELSDAALQAKVVPLKDKTYNLKLPAFQLTNLRGTPEQISKQILNQLIDHAQTAIKKQGLDRELAKLKAEAKEKIDEKKAELKQKTDSKVDEEKSKVTDKLKGLLNR